MEEYDFLAAIKLFLICTIGPLAVMMWIMTVFYILTRYWEYLNY
jgi:hypothetical protein